MLQYDLRTSTLTDAMNRTTAGGGCGGGGNLFLTSAAECAASAVLANHNYVTCIERSDTSYFSAHKLSEHAFSPAHVALMYRLALFGRNTV